MSAAHRLELSYESKCSALHGHNWIVRLWNAAPANFNADGMVADFTHIKRRITDAPDHKVLNDVLPFNPTAEKHRPVDRRHHPRMLPLRGNGKRGTALSMKKINEIFYSLQGEGHHTGYPSVFIRFRDATSTAASATHPTTEGIYMDNDAIIHAVNLYKADWIVLTGGEPSLWIDSDFIHLLKRATGKRLPSRPTARENFLPE